MSEQSAKPYLVRALYEWCVDQGYTPFLAVRVNEKTKVPMDYVKDGEIILNVSPLATHKLTMDNEWTLFNARFNGVSQEIAVPFAAVVGIFAKETGYGMVFQVDPEVLAPDVEQTAPVVAPAPALAAVSPIAATEAIETSATQATVQPTTTSSTKPKPTLTVVK